MFLNNFLNWVGFDVCQSNLGLDISLIEPKYTSKYLFNALWAYTDVFFLSTMAILVITLISF